MLLGHGGNCARWAWDVALLLGHGGNCARWAWDDALLLGHGGNCARWAWDDALLLGHGGNCARWAWGIHEVPAADCRPPVYRFPVQFSGSPFPGSPCPVRFFGSPVIRFPVRFLRQPSFPSGPAAVRDAPCTCPGGLDTPGRPRCPEGSSGARPVQGPSPGRPGPASATPRR